MDGSAFDPSPNIEDRRKEYSAYQQFLMDMGIPPLDHTDRTDQGLAPGQFDSGEYFDQTAPLVKGIPSALALDAGALDIGKPQTINDLLLMNDPISTKPLPRRK